MGTWNPEMEDPDSYTERRRMVYWALSEGKPVPEEMKQPLR